LPEDYPDEKKATSGLPLTPSPTLMGMGLPGHLEKTQA
jgi:hypothetical protein